MAVNFARLPELLARPGRGEGDGHLMSPGDDCHCQRGSPPSCSGCGALGAQSWRRCRRSSVCTRSRLQPRARRRICDLELRSGRPLLGSSPRREQRGVATVYSSAFRQRPPRLFVVPLKAGALLRASWVASVGQDPNPAVPDGVAWSASRWHAFVAPRPFVRQSRPHYRHQAVCSTKSSRKREYFQCVTTVCTTLRPDRPRLGINW
jgi:hypothetical protein